MKKKSRSSSNTSRSSMNKSIKVPKMMAMKKKNQRKTRKNIKTLFDKLRSQTNVYDNSLESICTLDNTLETINNTTINKKRKLNIETNNSGKRRKSDSVIIINDEDLLTNETLCNQTPKKESKIQCSTPIIKKDNKTLSELIVNTFPNNNSSTIPNLNDNVNLTRKINRDSYYTIDLTGNDSTRSKKVLDKTADETEESQNTVIDLINTTDVHDCSIISVIKPELSEHSLSGESDVTVLRNRRNAKSQMRKLVRGIAELNGSEKGHILEYITQTIFNGCNVKNNAKTGLTDVKETISNTEGNAENEYIKQMLIGKSPSRNSVGSNIYHPNRENKNKSGLRMIVIDGSNVAMQHGKHRVFSVEGLKICIDYFIRRGHRVKAFVPRFRCKFGKSSNPRLLDDLEREGSVVYTPSREVKGRTITPYDDRYIIQCAAEFDGVIVTGDNYRDLIHENAKWRFVIENRLLPFTWVDDMIMFPKDPLGRNGPTLEQFLRHPNIETVIKIT